MNSLRTKNVTVVVFRWMKFGGIVSLYYWANISIDCSRFISAHSQTLGRETLTRPHVAPTSLPYTNSLQTKTIPVVVFRWMRFSEILSPSFWANIWIDYSRFDPGYSDSRSAGYNIDVGNGHSTLLPTLFLMASMVRPVLSPKVGGGRTCADRLVRGVHYATLYR